MEKVAMAFFLLGALYLFAPGPLYRRHKALAYFSLAVIAFIGNRNSSEGFETPAVLFLVVVFVYIMVTLNPFYSTKTSSNREELDDLGD